MRWFFKPDYRSFHFLNATQFLSALNDNLFKLLVVYLLINVEGPATAARILSVAGAVFVIPFLLFSSAAGVLADRISKRTVIVFTRAFELLIMVFALFAVYFESELGCFTALFLMASQSAILGPSKYGIIPELVGSNMVSKANGAMTSFTFLAIILGTFLASFLADVSNKNFMFVAFCCLAVALLNLLTSLGIARTQPQRSTKRINPFFLYEIYQTLRFGRTIPHLLAAMFGSAFFLFMGAFAQLNVIPFAIESLGLDEVGGGYLFLPTAIGIALGAVLCGQISKDKIEPGISCLCGFMIGILFLLLSIFHSSLTLSVLFLGLLGVFGGAFLIPFDSFLQVHSPNEKRGQVIATCNFFSFIGVLLASLFLYAISEKMELSAADGFGLMGIFALIITFVISGRLSDLFFPFVVKNILPFWRKAALASSAPHLGSVIILRSNSWLDALLLFNFFPKLTLLIPNSLFRSFPWINGWVSSIRLIPLSVEPGPPPKVLTTRQDTVFCLFFHMKNDTGFALSSYEASLKDQGMEIFYAHGKKERLVRQTFFRFPRKLITFTFSKEK